MNLLRNRRIIAIANQKGGVGKTTTAVNLSACLALAGRRTLLIDLDPQANTTSFLGVEKSDVELSTYEVMIGGTSITESKRQVAVDMLDLLPSALRLVGAEVELLEMENREYILRNALLDSVLPHYDFVIIDCPPSLNMLTINALTAAQSVLIPLQCEYFALEGLGLLLETIQRIKQSLNPDLEIEGLVLTMYDGRLNLSRQVESEARRHFQDKVYRTVIQRNVRISEAPGFGKPIVLYDAHSVGAENYLSFAQEVMAS